jgi:ABC-2 type transport system ATP-binding protein
MSVTVRNITKWYGRQKALDDVSFSIEKGHVTGFLGPNGAGKSTMMKIITGFLPPSTGEVQVNGLEVRNHLLEVRRMIGYLPEHNPLYPEMYIREYLFYVAGIYRLGKEKKKRVEEIIGLTGLGPEQHKQIGSLSKGYRQRVGLAQALLHDPDVLILDEPTSGLDPNQILEIRELIKTLGREKTVLLSTHIMQEVEAICDRVIIIHKGRIIADESERSLVHLREKQSFFTIQAEFSEEVPVDHLTSLTHVLEVTPAGNHSFVLQCEADIREEIFRMAVEKGFTLRGLSLAARNLEDVFRELTKEG